MSCQLCASLTLQLMPTTLFEPTPLVSTDSKKLELAYGPDNSLDIFREILPDIKELKRRYFGLLIRLNILHGNLLREDRIFDENHTATEALGFIIDADQSIWWPRIHAILKQEHPIFEDVDRLRLAKAHDWENLPTMEVLSQLMRTRWTYAAELNKLTEEDFAKSGTHFLLGEITIRDIISILVQHDAHYIHKIKCMSEELVTAH